LDNPIGNNSKVQKVSLWGDVTTLPSRRPASQMYILASTSLQNLSKPINGRTQRLESGRRRSQDSSQMIFPKLEKESPESSTTTSNKRLFQLAQCRCNRDQDLLADPEVYHCSAGTSFIMTSWLRTYKICYILIGSCSSYVNNM